MSTSKINVHMLALGLAQSVPRTATWHDRLRQRQQQCNGQIEMTGRIGRDA